MRFFFNWKNQKRSLKPNIIERYNEGKLWAFPGGLHLPDMKMQSTATSIRRFALPDVFYVPLCQHAGKAGQLLVKEGDYVLKGQPLTQGYQLRMLPVHAPTSGEVIAINSYTANHPSGLTEPMVVIKADGKDQWCHKYPKSDFLNLSAQQIIDKIYQHGVAGLGGAVFPTASKVETASNRIKLLIINGAECEPYITCDDLLMREHAMEIIEGVRILRYVLRPEKVVIAIEDNKPQAIEAIKKVLIGANDIDIRVIPTKYPSGAAKQLIQILTGMEVPKGQRSSRIGVLMQNVATVYAIKKAVIDDEPLIERVVTLTGDKISQKGNVWVRLGTRFSHVLNQVGYQVDERLPLLVGGPMMGFTVSSLAIPVTKLTNCLLAPDYFEYEPPKEEKNCIRCSQCSDACPMTLLPQQLYWFARGEEHQKSLQYHLMDCMECGICAYVCPSHIPLIQYFRQEKAKIWENESKARYAEEAKERFEQRQLRLAKEKAEREERSQRLAESRRQQVAQQQGQDPVQAALARIKARQIEQGKTPAPSVKVKIGEQGERLPDNAKIMAHRKARRVAKQVQISKSSEQSAVETLNVLAENTQTSSVVTTTDMPTLSTPDPRKAAIAEAIARAKAKKAQTQQATANMPSEQSAVETLKVLAENTQTSSEVGTTDMPTLSTPDPRKAAIAEAIARAKAKKAQTQQATANMPSMPSEQSAVETLNVLAENTQTSSEVGTTDMPTLSIPDPRKAAIAEAIARAKAKKAQTQQATANTPSEQSAVETLKVLAENTQTSSVVTTTDMPTLSTPDPKKAAIAEAIARAKAKKAQTQQATVNTPSEQSAVETLKVLVENSQTSSGVSTTDMPTLSTPDPRKVAIAEAIARAKAKKAIREKGK